MSNMTLDGLIVGYSRDMFYIKSTLQSGFKLNIVIKYFIKSGNVEWLQ